MKIQINNITFNFKKQGGDHMPDGDNLGFSYLYIQENMLNRFKKECGWENGKLIPHYAEENMENMNYGRSGHECYNADTQIVLMHWLFDKRRKYKLDYQGLDPYWMFHDACHAEGDVSGYEMDSVYSYVEHTRLLEGAEFAAKHNIHMSADTLHKLNDAWQSRWKFREGTRYTKLDVPELMKYMKPTQLRLFEKLY